MRSTIINIWPLPTGLRILAGAVARRFALGIFGSIALLHGETRSSAQVSSQIQPSQVLVDNFTGWGTSLCWWGYMCGGYSNREAYAQLAFSSNHLALNLVRYNIGGGENPGIPNTMWYRAQMPGFEPANGVWDWNADQNQRWMLKRSLALGVNHVVAFANSPPWWMTVSGSVTGSSDGTSDNLQTGYENAFAGYLATVVSNLTIMDNVHFETVTPMNEPTGSWWIYGGHQEGCHMDPSQQARVVNDLRAALNAQNLSAGIDASEDTDEQDTINSVNSYGATQPYVTVVASHTYGANNPGGLHNLSVALRVPGWISEYSDGDGTGIPMARRIHDDITGAQVQAWFYWQVVDNIGGWGLLYNSEDASGDTNYTILEKYYVMWQFSHFIRPGYQIINSTDNNSLAAYDTTNKQLIVVAVNDTTNQSTFNYDLSAFASTAGKAIAWQTGPHRNGAPLPSLAITARQFSVSLPGQSVTTMVISNAILVPSPVAWYPLASNALDTSGNQNNALQVSGVTYVPGKIGAGAAQFTGNANSSIVIPRSISNSFTITCWVKTSAVGGGPQWWSGKGIVDGEVSGAVSDFGLCLVGGSAAFGIGNPDTTITSTTAINDGQWHHVAAEWNSLTGWMQLFVDGQLQASTLGPAGTRSAPPDLRIGGIQAGYAGGFLAGAIDDVRLFGRTLSSAEIVSTMNRAPVLSAVANQNLIAGQMLTLTNQASDPDLPAQTLTWTLAGAPAGSSLQPLNGTNAIFTWRPTISQSPSTNNVIITVADNGTPSLSATQNLSVIVYSPTNPVLSMTGIKSNSLSVTINGNAGPDYIIEMATSLVPGAIWLPVFTNTFAAPPFQWTDSSGGSQPEKFYRVRLAP